MSDDLRQRLQAFERELDAALDALPVLQWASTPSLHMASELYEAAAFKSENPYGAGYLDRGYTILARHFVAGSAGYEPGMSHGDDLKQMYGDLVFSSHYYMLRDYLYYSYNAPGSMEWIFDEGQVEIKFLDKTIPRQFFTTGNDVLLNSVHYFSDFRHHDEIMKLLENEPEGVVTPNVEAAEQLIAVEVDLKLSAYFSLIAADSQIDLGGYSYEQMLKVYRLLMMKALYHRYMAHAQKAVGAIYMPEGELVAGIEGDLGISPEIARLILQDLVFDPSATADRVDASYFSLMREGGTNGRIVMRPHHFAITEGLVNILRVIAQRRPKTFLGQISNEIGRAFVARVRAAWEAEGFICASEVSLRDFDRSLPDIDLIVISFEPTLGYAIYICELKSPIPPRWAKDQLKVLNKDSVSKAFRQVEILQKFIRTEAGLRFLDGILPEGGHTHFDGFIVTIDHLIITSDNSGMFFGSEATKIMNFRTLERLLRRSDGDMALIQHVLNTYNTHADDATATTVVQFQVGPINVLYETVTESPLMEFPQGSWNSTADRQEMVESFIADGFHPFDSLEHRLPDAVVRRSDDGEPEGN